MASPGNQHCANCISAFLYPISLSSAQLGLVNCVLTGKGPCRANMRKKGLAQSPFCDCGQ